MTLAADANPAQGSLLLKRRWSSMTVDPPASAFDPVDAAPAAAPAPAAGLAGASGGAQVLATVSVFPPHEYPQSAFSEAYIQRHKLTPEDQAWVRRVFDATMIETCQSYLPKDRLFEKMSRPEYVDYIKPSLQDLGTRAAESVLAQWGGDRQAITHIVWGTMTGSIHAPTMDVVLTRELGLRPSVKRLNVEGMGCLTGFRCLNQAAEIAAAGADNVVLVVVCDIRSALQNQLQPHDDGAPVHRSDVIVCSLFRDSGGAAIVASRGAAAAGGATSKPLYDVLEGRSYVLPNSGHMVDMRELGGDAIRLVIAKELPDAVKAALPDLVADLLKPHGVSLDDCCFAIHTGGPKVIRNVAAALGVAPETLGASWHVMRKHGNLSGSSNLVVLDHLRRLAAEGAEGVEEKRYCVCISMGPGVAVEAVLLRACNWDDARMKRRGTSMLVLPDPTPEEDELVLLS